MALAFTGMVCVAVRTKNPGVSRGLKPTGFFVSEPQRYLWFGLSFCLCCLLARHIACDYGRHLRYLQFPLFGILLMPATTAGINGTYTYGG